ncbi:unnamed protein product [Cyprideis torosa]|uniref:Uncharacterized protein n=1 Tax=Cyprideis torosa TaxID=163714 RepID=A0A7R8WBZ5_9CRUS|nr:unnamed protein product [Cyprideis torosa]CAG0886872.1 unnamed protein product [Cyprideis torosa]
MIVLIFRCILLCLCALNFFLSAAVLNGIQFILRLILRPFSPWAYRKINYYLTYSIFANVVFLCYWWSGSVLRLYVKKSQLEPLGKETAILVMNHTWEVDWIFSWVVCDYFKILGNAKCYAKTMLKYVPVIGWTWTLSDFVFLQRDWDRDKEVIARSLRNLLSYADPVWMLIFAEGTRFTPEKHAQSVEVAKRKGLPIFKNVLLPRVRGCLATVQEFKKGDVPALYDCTVMFDEVNGNKATLKNLLLGRRIICDLLVERLPLKEVPDTLETCTAWINELFAKKDSNMEYYKTHNNNYDLDFNEYQVIVMTGRFSGFFLIMFWLYFVTIPFCQFILGLISGVTAALITLAILSGLTAVALYKLTGLTKVSQASSYGKAKGTSTGEAKVVSNGSGVSH